MEQLNMFAPVYAPLPYAPIIPPLPKPDRVRPDYVIKSYPGDFNRVVRMKNGDNLSRDRGKEDMTKIVFRKSNKLAPGEKFRSSVIRARSMVLDKGFCNSWDYFGTFTLDASKYDRYDLAVFRKDLAQLVRNLRRDTGANIQYMLIPERHMDGAWHLHGLFSGIPENEFAEFVPGLHPRKLINGKYRNWPRYEKRFGFCSFGKVRNGQACVRYLLKYISKSFLSPSADEIDPQIYTHTYFCSQGLQKPDKAHCVGYVPEFDKIASFEAPYAYVGEIYCDMSTLIDLVARRGMWIYDVTERKETACNAVEDDWWPWPD